MITDWCYTCKFITSQIERGKVSQCKVCYYLNKLNKDKRTTNENIDDIYIQGDIFII